MLDLYTFNLCLMAYINAKYINLPLVEFFELISRTYYLETIHALNVCVPGYHCMKGTFAKM